MGKGQICRIDPERSRNFARPNTSAQKLRSTPSATGAFTQDASLAQGSQERRVALGLDPRAVQGALAGAIVPTGRDPRVEPEGSTVGGDRSDPCGQSRHPPPCGEGSRVGEDWPGFLGLCFQPTIGRGGSRTIWPLPPAVLVPILARLERAFSRHADIVGLRLAQLGQLGAQLGQMQFRDLLIEVLG